MEVRGEEKEGGQKGVNKDKEGKGWKREGEQGAQELLVTQGPPPPGLVALVFFCCAAQCPSHQLEC